ncbi:hypothetical protein [Aeromicrobium piscarium]|uniref:Uncharacterized protein n=1 Tax=Aeromicrobium piscarium TaxID=2590901 RepID=A0A554RJT1_9ACTN|nr:hypothetical protein [Aeromicrobium piscarium]TSD54405.1 hypothetical protein FNM00_17640 [Aeromicrobium piscarium]
MRWSTRQSLLWSAITGALFGVFFAAWSGIVDGQTAARAVVSGVVAGLVFGALLGLLQLREFRVQEDDGADELTFRQRRRVTRAVTRGDVPTDPVMRKATLAAARRRLRWYHDRAAWLYRICFGALLILTVISAIDDSPVLWLAVPLYAGLLAYAEWERRRLPRRIARLEA